MLDEFGNAGEIDTLLTMMPLMRKYGLRVVPIVQDTAQIERNYERTGSEIFRTSATIQVFLNFASSKDARYISDLAGTTTVFIKSSSYSFHHGRRQRHANDQPISKQVLPVNYLQSMPDHRSIVRVSGYPVFEVTKIEGYQDPRFAAHKLHNPVQPPKVVVAKSGDIRRTIENTADGRRIFISDLDGLKERLHLSGDNAEPIEKALIASEVEPLDPMRAKDYRRAEGIVEFRRPGAASTNATAVLMSKETMIAPLPQHHPETGEVLDDDLSRSEGTTQAADAAEPQIEPRVSDVRQKSVVDNGQDAWLAGACIGSGPLPPLTKATVFNLNPIIESTGQVLAAAVSNEEERKQLVATLLEPLVGERD
jgi:hypothetical protein